MIQNDDELARAQQALFNVQKFLAEARKVHSAREYRAMAAPFLLEIQQREQEILEYLSRVADEVPAGP